MKNTVLVFSALVAAIPAVSGFASNNLVRSSRSTCHQSTLQQQSSLGVASGRGDELQQSGEEQQLSRRQAIGTAASIAASALLIGSPTVSNADIEGVVTIPQSTAPPESTAKNVDGKSVTVFKTKSGLQYIDIEVGTGPSPKYGNFASISYEAYVKLPDIQGQPSKLDPFDSDKGYLVKHGNGRTVPGLDEGLHTMRVGGKRRIIVPPKLGYVSSGLGPVPPGPYGRWKLNRLIDRMVEVKGGNLVFDVEMKSILEDEADQGYYEDDSLSPEDFNTLRQNVEAKYAAERAAKEKA